MRHNAVVQKCASPLDHPTTPQVFTSAGSYPAKLRRKNRERTEVLTTFRMNTCKSVSKQRTLSPFRMNTCEKPGGKGCSASTVGGKSVHLQTSRCNAHQNHARST